MAMKKAEMEGHDEQYRALVARAHAAEARGLVRAAVNNALAAWEHLDGMVQYARRYGSQEFESFAAIDLVMKYAPLLLDAGLLDRVEQLLDDSKRIEKATAVDDRAQLAEARARLWENHRLWDYLEQNPGAAQAGLRQVLGGEQARWRNVAEAWERMGLLARERDDSGAYRLSLSTRLGQVVPAKCPACGQVSEAPKAMFLERMKCPECAASVWFVLLATDRQLS